MENKYRILEKKIENRIEYYAQIFHPELIIKGRRGLYGQGEKYEEIVSEHWDNIGPNYPKIEPQKTYDESLQIINDHKQIKLNVLV